MAALFVQNSRVGRALVIPQILVQLSIEFATSAVGAPLVGALGMGGHKGRPYRIAGFYPDWQQSG